MLPGLVKYMLNLRKFKDVIKKLLINIELYNIDEFNNRTKSEIFNKKYLSG